MPRKPRSDSKLDGLSEEQQLLLAEWLTVENMSYAKAKERVEAEFSVGTSVGALQSFYSRFAAPWKYARAHSAAETIAGLMEGKFDQANIKRAQELTFDAMSGPTPDIETASALMKMLTDSAKVALAKEKVGLDARKVKLLELKAAQADKAEGVTRDDTLTPEMREQKLKEIFGLK